MSLKVALSGAGYVAPFHLAAWAKADATVVAIADPDLDRAGQRADEFGIEHVYGSFEEMLDKGDFDALDIASPREVHIKQSIAGLHEGLAVLCQKPVAVSLDDANHLLSRLSEVDRLMVHENWRFRPEYRQIAAWIEDGELGPLRHATFTMRTRALLPDSDGRRPALQRQPFFASEKRMLVAEVLIHHLDTARRLCGELQLKSSFLQRTQDDLPGETYAAVELMSSTGSPVFVTGDMTAAGAPPGASDHTEICGRNGRIVFDGSCVALYALDGTTKNFEIPDDASLQSSFDTAIDHFVQCCTNGQPFETSLRDNLETLKLVEQVYETAGGLMR